MSNYAFPLDTTENLLADTKLCSNNTTTLSSSFLRLDVSFTKAIYQTKIKISTCRTSIKLHPHGNVSVPAPRTDTDEASLDTGEQTVLYNAVLVSVTRKVL